MVHFQITVRARWIRFAQGACCAIRSRSSAIRQVCGQRLHHQQLTLFILSLAVAPILPRAPRRHQYARIKQHICVRHHVPLSHQESASETIKTANAHSRNKNITCCLRAGSAHLAAFVFALAIFTSSSSAAITIDGVGAAVAIASADTSGVLGILAATTAS
jgi:hypothetical protein